jgi:hypothetical protein
MKPPTEQQKAELVDVLEKLFTTDRKVASREAVAEEIAHFEQQNGVRFSAEAIVYIFESAAEAFVNNMIQLAMDSASSAQQKEAICALWRGKLPAARRKIAIASALREIYNDYKDAH